MQGTHFVLPVYVPGTLAASYTVSVPVPLDSQLVKVSTSNTTANAGTLQLGTLASAAAYLASCSFGVSSLNVEYDRDNFVGTQYPTFSAGDIIYVTITDHASHMADPYVALTFTEG